MLDGREVFVSFRDFPWFAVATIQQIPDVRRPRRQHLHWPALDVDLAVESSDHPIAFPSQAVLGRVPNHSDFTGLYQMNPIDSFRVVRIPHR